jgi:hypothetical protein
MGIEWDFSGFHLAEFAKQVEARIPKALATGMEVVRTVTTPKVPVETGNLVGSGDVSVIGMVASLSYAGPYARYQEFGVFYRHGRFGAPLTHTHGQSFFLTTSIVEAKDAAIRAVGEVLFE